MWSQANIITNRGVELVPSKGTYVRLIITGQMAGLNQGAQITMGVSGNHALTNPLIMV